MRGRGRGAYAPPSPTQLNQIRAKKEAGTFWGRGADGAALRSEGFEICFGRGIAGLAVERKGNLIALSSTLNESGGYASERDSDRGSFKKTF